MPQFLVLTSYTLIFPPQRICIYSLTWQQRWITDECSDRCCFRLLCPTVLLYLFWSRPHWCSVHAGYSHTSSRPFQTLASIRGTCLTYSSSFPLCSQGHDPYSHTITCCLSHTLTLSSWFSKSLFFVDAYLCLSLCLLFFSSSLLLQGSCCHIYCISSLMGYQETLCNTPTSLFCQSRQVPNYFSTLPSSKARFFPTANSLSITLLIAMVKRNLFIHSFYRVNHWLINVPSLFHLLF